MLLQYICNQTQALLFQCYPRYSCLILRPRAKWASIRRKKCKQPPKLRNLSNSYFTVPCASVQGSSVLLSESNTHTTHTHCCFFKAISGFLLRFWCWCTQLMKSSWDHVDTSCPDLSAELYSTWIQPFTKQSYR